MYKKNFWFSIFFTCGYVFLVLGRFHQYAKDDKRLGALQPTNCRGKDHVAQRIAMRIVNKLDEIYTAVLTKDLALNDKS